MSFPLNKMVIPVPDLINPSRGMPAYQFDRSVDALDGPVSSGGGGPAPAGPYPFDVEFSGSGSPLTATIRPGTINGLLPSDYSDTYSITVPGLYYFVLSATVASGEVSAATLSMDGSPPPGIPVELGEPPVAFQYLLGVIVDGVWYRTIGPGSLNAAGQEVFRISKLSPTPGTLPYEIYYTWNITS